MKKSTKRKIEDILKDYPKIDEYIEKREDELRYPHVEDDAIGSKPQNVRNEKIENTLITIDEDKRLNAFKRQRDIVSDCLEAAGSDTETIIRELYFKRYPTYTLTGLVTNNKLNCGKQKAYYLRNDFIKEVAERLGLYDV